MDNLAGIAQTLASVSAMGRATTVRQWTRVVAALAAGAVALTMMTACAPEPVTVPSPTPTGFASEQEAFAAAEATYRAYIDALNRVDLADPATFEPVFAHLMGEALADSRKNLTSLHAQAYVLAGTTDFTNPTLSSTNLGLGEVVLDVCLDVTNVDVSDSTGASVVSPDRADLQPLRVVFATRPTPLELAITRSEASEVDTCGG